jgi:hypothetical protein
MKKVFYFIAAAVIGLTFTACNKDKQNTVTTDEIKVELSAVYDETDIQPIISVKISDETAPFVLFPFTAEQIGNFSDDEIVKAILQSNPSTLKKSGDYHFNDMIWEAGATYKIYAFAINTTELKASSNIAVVSVDIPLSSSNKLSVQFDNQESLQVAATNDDPYFVDVITADAWAKLLNEGGSAAQYVIASLENYIAASETKHAGEEDSTYTYLANLYLFNGSQTISLLENIDALPAGKYVATAAGVKLVDKKDSYRIQPSTAGVSAEFELTQDLVYSEVKSLVDTKLREAKARRIGELVIDFNKMHKASRVK